MQYLFHLASYVGHWVCLFLGWGPYVWHCVCLFLWDLCLALRLSVFCGIYVWHWVYLCVLLFVNRLLTPMLTLILASQYVVQNHTGQDHIPDCFWG